MSILRNSRNVRIYEGYFIAQGYQQPGIDSEYGDHIPPGDELKDLYDLLGIRLLARNTHAGSFHDSYERQSRPRSPLKNGTEILEMIAFWAQDTAADPIFWLKEPAGKEKSAIAQTVCDHAYREGLLAASIFLSRVGGLNDARKIVPTLVYQLVRTIPSIRGRVLHAIETDPLIFSRSVEMQLQTLVCEPLRDESHLRTNPMLVVIDGLDECNDGVLVVKTFAEAIERGSLPLRLLICSRPKADLQAVFESIAHITYSRTPVSSSYTSYVLPIIDKHSPPFFFLLLIDKPVFVQPLEILVAPICLASS
jgi:hypothetical protein